MSDAGGPGDFERARSSGGDWFLGNAEDQHTAAPRSFFIPSRRERESLQIGRDVRLTFYLRNPAPGQPGAERMWLEVVSRDENGSYVGGLKNQPVAIEDLGAEQLVRFGPEHVIAVDDPRWIPYEDKVAFVSRRLVEDDSLEPNFAYHDPSDEERSPRPDGRRTSGWQLFVGDEDDAEINDPANVLLPDLSWLMERYPPFGDLVFSGARDGEWQLDLHARAYRQLPR